MSQMNEAQNPNCGESQGSHHINCCHDRSYGQSTEVVLHLHGASLLNKHR